MPSSNLFPAAAHICPFTTCASKTIILTVSFELGVLVHNKGMQVKPVPKAAEPAQLSRGKLAHKQEPILPGEKAEVTTPSGKRMDRYNEDTGHIREIKPNNPRGVRSGEKQLQGYKQEMEGATGKPHTTELQDL